MTTTAEARVIELLEQILSALQRDRETGPSLLLDATALAAELDVNVRTLRRMRQDKGFPKPVRINNSVRWRRNEVERFMRARKP